MSEQATAIEAIRKRADQARVPMYKVCEEAKIAPATLTRWKTDPASARWSTIGKLEKALTRIEEREA